MKAFGISAALIIVAVFGIWFISKPAQNAETALFEGYSTTTITMDSNANTPGATPENPAQATGPATVAPSASVPQNITRATLHTNQGDITIEFFAADAPNTVANFIKLASTGFYNGTKFHRVIAGFMIQGGDPLTKDDAQAARWGTGGPGYQFADEIRANNHNVVGTISMANAGPNTNGSQFFINTADNSFLDGKHTTFGKVVAGMEVVKKIEATQTGQGDRPVTPMVINSVTLE